MSDIVPHLTLLPLQLYEVRKRKWLSVATRILCGQTRRVALPAWPTTSVQDTSRVKLHFRLRKFSSEHVCIPNLSCMSSFEAQLPVFRWSLSLLRSKRSLFEFRFTCSLVSFDGVFSVYTGSHWTKGKVDPHTLYPLNIRSHVNVKDLELFIVCAAFKWPFDHVQLRVSFFCTW